LSSTIKLLRSTQVRIAFVARNVRKHKLVVSDIFEKRQSAKVLLGRWVCTTGATAVRANHLSGSMLIAGKPLTRHDLVNRTN
jgi:hypothetical protein